VWCISSNSIRFLGRLSLMPAFISLWTYPTVI
jgi:hypothetical protein